MFTNQPLVSSIHDIVGALVTAGVMMRVDLDCDCTKLANLKHNGPIINNVFKNSILLQTGLNLSCMLSQSIAFAARQHRAAQLFQQCLTSLMSLSPDPLSLVQNILRAKKL